MAIALNPTRDEVESALMRIRASGNVPYMDLWDCADNVVELAAAGKVSEGQLQAYLAALQTSPA